MKHKGLNQLVCAAMINARFRETLLRDPARAIKAGYQGQKFSLTHEEHTLVTNIRAQGLEDFASQVVAWMQTGGQVLHPYNEAIPVEYAYRQV